MSATDRQNRLLVAEDWKRIYQSYRNADFQSYDFDNLRRVMITYIRENYPEDFNDYIESSEYLALIDLISFMGQSISFRTDLNARENFLELADRRDSVLRLARLLSYNPKRNITSSGLLKFNSVQTTQSVYDSNGRDMTGQTILWNDSSNKNWYDQFIKVINAALPMSRQFGNPDDSGLIYGIQSEQYRLQATTNDVPIYKFSKSVDGRNMAFEIVSTTFKNSTEIYEEPPIYGNKLAFLFRDDGKGHGSINTGFFVHFKQGILSKGTFTISQPSTNESVDLDAVNINNSDVWLYKLDEMGNEVEAWTGVPALEGNNIIYNSLSKKIKNIFSVLTRDSDRISLLFSDGTFGNLPLGTFKVYYRASNGLSYTINPKDIRNVSVAIPYISNTGHTETLTISMNLETSIANSSATETTNSIKSNAPGSYYVQDRMITGEDYNIAPLAVSQDVMKIKSINRTSSGISRYFDLIDPTGKYSKTNLFSDDGAIYKEEFFDSFRFSYNTKTQIEAIIYNNISGILKSIQLRDFYYDKYKKEVTGYYPLHTIKWKNKTNDTNYTTGLFYNSVTGHDIGVSTILYLSAGALLKFNTSTGTMWTTVIKILGDGTTIENGFGPISFTDNIPMDAELVGIIPVWKTSLDSNTITALVELIYGNKPFGLRHDIAAMKWKIIYDINLNTSQSFNTSHAGDTNGQHADSSWLLLFTTDTEYYTVKQRLVRYIFESNKQVRFFFNSSNKIYDTKTNTVIKDNITILAINEQISGNTAYDRKWQIINNHVGSDGYVDNKKIQLTFSDSDDDGIVDNPELFEEFVPSVVVHDNGTAIGYIVEESYISDELNDYRLSSGNDVIFTTTDITDLSSYPITIPPTQYFYNTNTNVVTEVHEIGGIRLLVATLDRKVYLGKNNIKFQYIHNADNESRIDPGLSNIIDIYVLTKKYDTIYRQWLNGSITKQPLPPSTDALHSMMSTSLNKIKSINDEVIYHPVKFKVLFGQKASSDVRATFKIVKNNEMAISDNDIKSRVLTAINTFFNLENWDFGDKFYFSELIAYTMNRVSPYLVNFIIVPKMSELTFGSLYEINAEKDEIFINGATIDDIEIITAVTASKIKSAGSIAIDNTSIQNIILVSQGNN